METTTVLRALSSQLRLELASRLRRPKSVSELMKDLTQVKYRETVYRALETLVTVGIVDKKYDPKGKQIVYGLRYSTAEIDLLSGNITYRVISSDRITENP